MADALKIALDYISRGFSPIPVPFRTKKPIIKKWQDLRITEATAVQYFNGEAQNVGVLLDPASGGLTDVDLDSPEAIAAAPFFLPHTACFGRASKRFSHWLYITDLAGAP